jgi:hypothetical protein
MKRWHRGSVIAVGLAVAAMLMASSVQAQPPGQGRGQGRGQARGGPGGMRAPGMFGGMGMMGGGMGKLMMLQRADIRKGLELLDDQVAQLEKLREGFFTNMREMRNASPEERQAQMKELENQVGDVLLPHQAERLDQLVLQLSLRSGIGRAVQNPELREKLGLTEAQAEQLAKKEGELEAQMRKELMEKLLATLPSDQQQKIKGLIGEPFEFQAQERGQRMFGGRAPAGPGGGRPQRPGGARGGR